MQDKSGQAEGEPGSIPANPTPLVGDIESGFNQSEKAGEAMQIKGGLLIPGTILKGSGKDPNEDSEEPEATTISSSPLPSMSPTAKSNLPSALIGSLYFMGLSSVSEIGLLLTIPWG